MEFVSQNIKHLRKERNLSQKQVAMEINMAQGQYSRVESGKVVPTLPTLAKIAEVFQVKLVELVKETIDEDDMNIENIENFPLLERIKLLSLLDKEEKDALTKIIDIAIAKRKMRDSLNQLLAS